MQATLKESRLSRGGRCVLEVHVALSAWRPFHAILWDAMEGGRRAWPRAEECDDDWQ